jgi:hypothetical protein
MTTKQRRQAIITYAREEISPGRSYSKGMGGMTWPSVLRRIIVPADMGETFKTVDVVVGGMPRPELTKMPIEISRPSEMAPPCVDFDDVPLSMITVDPGVDVEISSTNTSRTKLFFQAALFIDVDVPAEEGESAGDRRRMFDAGPITVAPGGKATLVVSPAEERPFSIEMVNVVSKGEGAALVTSLAVGSMEQLSGDPVPAVVLHRCRMLMLPVVTAMQRVEMRVENPTDAPVAIYLKLEGVSLDIAVEERGVGMSRADLLSMYGKFAQPADGSEGDDDDDDDDDEEEDD